MTTEGYRNPMTTVDIFIVLDHQQFEDAEASIRPATDPALLGRQERIHMSGEST